MQQLACNDLRSRGESNIFVLLDPGMNAAVRAVTRMGIYVGAKVYLIYEVNQLFHSVCINMTLLYTHIEFILA